MTQLFFFFFFLWNSGTLGNPVSPFSKTLVKLRRETEIIDVPKPVLYVKETFSKRSRWSGPCITSNQEGNTVKVASHE